MVRSDLLLFKRIWSTTTALTEIWAYFLTSYMTLGLGNCTKKTIYTYTILSPKLSRKL